MNDKNEKYETDNNSDIIISDYEKKLLNLNNKIKKFESE